MLSEEAHDDLARLETDRVITTRWMQAPASSPHRVATTGRYIVLWRRSPMASLSRGWQSCRPRQRGTVPRDDGAGAAPPAFGTLRIAVMPPGHRQSCTASARRWRSNRCRQLVVMAAADGYVDAYLHAGGQWGKWDSRRRLG